MKFNDKAPGFKEIQINKTDDNKIELILLAPNNSINKEALKKPPAFVLINHGPNINPLSYVQEKQYIQLTIKNQRKALSAVNFILDNKDLFSITEESEIYNSLVNAQKELQGNIKPYQPPIKSKNIKDFKNAGAFHTKTKGRHEISQLTKVGKAGEKTYLYKTDRVQRSILEIEAFNSFCYRLLLGDRTPKMRPLHDEGSRVGLAIEPIKGYKSFLEYYQENGRFPLDAELLMETNVPEIWAAAYWNDENDLHAGNYGLANFRSVKIDNDQATFTVTAKYLGLKAQDRFDVSEEDIVNFPLLKTAKPFNAPDRQNEPNIFPIEEMRKHKEFYPQVYYIFLKGLLIDEAIYQAAAEATISSPKLQEELVKTKSEKTKKFESVLLKMPSFQRYIVQNPHAIGRILNEFKEYNKDFKDPKYHFLHVDLEKIQKNHSKMFQRCQQELILAANKKGVSTPTAEEARNQLRRKFPEEFAIIDKITTIRQDLKAYKLDREAPGHKSFFRKDLTDQKINIAKTAIISLNDLENTIIRTLGNRPFKESFEELSTIIKSSIEDAKEAEKSFFTIRKGDLMEILEDATRSLAKTEDELTRKFV